MKIYKTKCPEIALRKKDGTIMKAQIKCSLDAFKYFKELFDQNTIEIREEFIIIYLNQANNTVGWFRAGVGGIAGVFVDIRLIFKQALECNASSMMVAHNHPSGQLKPSQQDYTITEKIRNAGALMDIKLLDHVIITADNYYSFADDGRL